ncbi:MAG: tetratricopeptide repeat protein [Spirochaetia bacterium]|jgi:tetratricopeptide (TPR) repeat protein|nr:tetratricopeptide repeat protein [Spirochaetia bacterium]
MPIIKKICGLLPVCAAALLALGCATQAGTPEGGFEKPLPEEEELYTSVAYSLSTGDPMQAVRALEEARKRNPDSLETKQLLVDVLLIAQELEEARLVVDDILREDPDNRNALYSLALIESAQGNASAQREILQRLLAINPADDRAQAALGEIFLRERKYADAEKLFAQSLEGNPQNLVALIGKGNTQLRRGKAEDAAKTLTRVIELQPDYPFAYADRGRAHADAGNIEGAEADITKAIELIPDYAWNYYDRGKLRAQTGSTEAALEDLNTALGMDPSISLAYFYRARIYDGMDRIDEAYEDYRKAQSMNPKYAYINLPLAILEYKKGNWMRAASCFIKASDAERDEHAYHLLAALCYKKAGDQKKASDYLAGIMGKLPRDTLFYHMARYYMQPSSDLFIVQQVQAEKNKVLRSRMLFYLAAQYMLQNRMPGARTYFLDASGEANNGYIENRLAAWELKKLEGKQ